MHPLLESLQRNARSFGPELEQLAFSRGLAVELKDGGQKPIPTTATPIVVEKAQMDQRLTLSAQLASAGFKMARAIVLGPDRDVLLSALSPLEKAVTESTHAALRHLALARVDFFISTAGETRALELNSTIPAMVGYSDIAARAFIEVVGRRLGVNDGVIARLWAKNGSNVLALYRALLEGYAAERPGKMPERIALLCRRGDSQLPELRFCAERFTELGTETDIVYPDQLTLSPHLEVNGRRYDLVYRHLFVRRLEEVDAPAARQLYMSIPNPHVVVLNAPSSPVEVKTVFALLSQATVDAKLAAAAGLDADELAAVAAAVPWTRSLRPQPGTGPEGEKIDNLVERVARDPARFVLKRAWDYGGRAVFVGRTFGEPSFQERVRGAYGQEMGWKELCERAAADSVGGGYVVQEVVQAKPQSHLLVQGGEVKPVELYVDFSAFTSVGLARMPAWTGVCRGSPAPVVNIMGGGGVLPLITAEVADTLYTALRASGWQ